MADTIDDAQAVNELHQDVSLRNQRAKAFPESHPDFDGYHCVEPDCGVELPQLRLQWGRVRCVDCQGRLEEMARYTAIRGQPTDE